MPLYTAVDWIFNAPGWFDDPLVTAISIKWRDPFNLDAAWGEAKSLTEVNDDVTGELYGMGFGLQFSHQNRFQGNLQLAFPIKEDFSSEVDVPDDSVKLVFDFQYGLR